jgi:hypothetical protein
MMLLCCAVVAACGSSSGSETFHANMTAAQEVPLPTGLANPPPTGTAVFTNNGDGTVSYTVNASGLTTQFSTTASPVTFTGMHIHLGAVGVRADIAVPLTTPTPGATAGTTTVTGTFTSGTCTTGAVNCINAGNTIDTVLAAMRNGGAYLNIHTSRNGQGELRGQVQTGGL